MLDLITLVLRIAGSSLVNATFNADNPLLAVVYKRLLDDLHTTVPATAPSTAGLYCTISVVHSSFVRDRLARYEKSKGWKIHRLLVTHVIGESVIMAIVVNEFVKYKTVHSLSDSKLDVTAKCSGSLRATSVCNLLCSSM